MNLRQITIQRCIMWQAEARRAAYYARQTNGALAPSHTIGWQREAAACAELARNHLDRILGVGAIVEQR